MVLSTTFEPPDLLVATVTGTLTGGDQARLVEWIRDAIRAAGNVRVLLQLDQFAGWSPVVGAVNGAPLWLRDNERVQKMAIVGDPQWKRQVLTIAAYPIRSIPIDYFETEDAAREWLEQRDVS